MDIIFHHGENMNRLPNLNISITSWCNYDLQLNLDIVSHITYCKRISYLLHMKEILDESH
jgi:hypothetical protein